MLAGKYEKVKRTRDEEMRTKGLTIIMEPSVFERLRVEAFEERCSVEEIVRRSVAVYLAGRARGREKKGRAR